MSKEVSIGKVDKGDKVIAVMGPTGVGKSTFINVATGGRLDKLVGHDLKSKTVGVTAVRMGAPHGDVVLVDTPGFNDTNRSDSDILKLIAAWLEKTYRKGVKLAGIIYLHRITDNRMGGSPLLNLRMFANLCGDGAIRRVILATTMWGRLPNQELGKQREKELHGRYWNGMIELGSATQRFYNTQESAWAVLNLALEMDKNDQHILLLQEELVHLEKKLGETAAGKTLYEDLQKQLSKHKEAVQEIRAATVGQSNQQLLEDLEKQCDEAMERVRDMINQINELKVPLSRRILSLFTFRKTHVKSLEI